MRFPIGAMSTGDILDRGLKLLLARLPTFFLINLIIMFPAILLQLAAPKVGEVAAQGNPATGLAMIMGLIGFLLLVLILQPIGTAAVLRVIAQEFADRPISLGSALGFGLRHFLPLLGTMILFGLSIGVGFLLCLIPGFLFLSWYALAQQVVVVEGISGNTAMNRSKELTAGFRWRVLGLILLFALINVIGGALIGSLELVLPSQERVPIGPNQGPFAPAVVRIVSYPNYALQIILAGLYNILVQSYQAVCMTLLYFDLRIRKEGYDLELAAEREVPSLE